MSTHDEVNRALNQMVGEPRAAFDPDAEVAPSTEQPPSRGAGLPCLPCVRCGDNLNPVVREEHARTDRSAQPLAGVRFRGVPNYGSEYDEHGEFEIVLCDDCLTVAARRGRINLVAEYRVTTTRRKLFDPDRTDIDPDRSPTCRPI